MLIAIFFVLLYGLLGLLVLELILWIIGMFIALPPKARQLCYAIVAVLVIIGILQVVLGAGGLHLPLQR